MLQQFPLELWLLNEGIIPTDKVTYRPEKLRKAIHMESGLSVYLRCRKVEEETVLTAIGFCIRIVESQLKTENCSDVDFNCGSSLKYIHLPPPEAQAPDGSKVPL